MATLLLATLVVTIGATLQGSVGFGLGMFAAPLLILIDPRFVPGPLLCTAVVFTLLLTHRERHGVHFADLKWSLTGRIVGIAAAMLALSVVPGERVAVLSGSLILVAVGLSASGLHLTIAPASLVGAGALSGLIGTAVSAGGPPMALLYQRETGARIRGTLSMYFFFGVTMSLAGLSFIGRFGWDEIVLACWLLPGALFGFVISRRAAQVLDRGAIRTAVLLVSGLSGIVVLLSGVV
ncbi:MAG: sulfite exporter TauE/SafE family protein [Gemmatimonadales bacterium]